MKIRNLLMKSLAADPRFTLEAIGGFFGLTRERVRQVVGNGVSRCSRRIRREFSDPDKRDVAMMRELKALGLDRDLAFWLLGHTGSSRRQRRIRLGSPGRPGAPLVECVWILSRNALMAQAMADGATDGDLVEIFGVSRGNLSAARRNGKLPRNPNLGSVAWEGRRRREEP